MECPHLTKLLLSYCKAGDDVYFPSPFQLVEYCKSGNYRKCPFLIGTDDFFHGLKAGHGLFQGTDKVSR